MLIVGGGGDGGLHGVFASLGGDGWRIGFIGSTPDLIQVGDFAVLCVAGHHRAFGCIAVGPAVQGDGGAQRGLADGACGFSGDGHIVVPGAGTGDGLVSRIDGDGDVRSHIGIFKSAGEALDGDGIAGNHASVYRCGNCGNGVAIVGLVGHGDGGGDRLLGDAGGGGGLLAGICQTVLACIVSREGQADDGDGLVCAHILIFEGAGSVDSNRVAADHAA